MRVLPPTTGLSPELFPCAVEDGDFSSSFRDDTVGTGHGRGGLYSPLCWRPKKAEAAAPRQGPIDSSTSMWYQLDLKQSVHVSGVVTKGRAAVGPHGTGVGKPTDAQFVSTFRVMSTEDSHHIPQTWTDVDSGRLFQNCVTNNPDIEMESMFSEPITARYVRIHPVACQHHMCLRAAALTIGEIPPIEDEEEDEQQAIDQSQLSRELSKGQKATIVHHKKVTPPYPTLALLASACYLLVTCFSPRTDMALILHPFRLKRKWFAIQSSALVLSPQS